MPTKRPIPILATLLCMAAAAHAQRSGTHAGPPPHASPSFHSSAAPTTAFRPAPPAYAARSRVIAPAPSARSIYRSYGAPGISPNRPTFYRSGPRNPDHRFPDRHRPIVYIGTYGYAGYIDPGYLDYVGPYLDDTTQTEDAPPNTADQDGIYAGPYVDNYRDQRDPADDESYNQSTDLRAPAAPLPAPDAVTLVFKDGHTQQIHNFIATRSSISIIQGQRHYDIPVDDLDLPATQQANRAAGVGFTLPGMPQ